MARVRITMCGALAVLMTLGAARAAVAQGGSLKEVQAADLQTMKDKFTALAAAFPDDKYDWRPMEGVRSVKEVLILITNEGNAFPTQWGASPPPWVAADRNAEAARLQGLANAALRQELARAFDNIIGVVQRMDDAARMREVRFFGQQVQTSGAILMATADMHEHLGQLIAYARMNRIVPPWSR